MKTVSILVPKQQFLTGFLTDFPDFDCIGRFKYGGFFSKIRQIKAAINTAAKLQSKLYHVINLGLCYWSIQNLLCYDWLVKERYFNILYIMFDQVVITTDLS